MMKVTSIQTGTARLKQAQERGREGHSPLGRKVDGVTYDPAVSLRMLRAIKAFAAQEPTVLLPSHDPEGPARLAENRVYA